MTGDQLDKFISMLDILLDDFEENFPELKNEVLIKRRNLTFLDKITEEERDEKENAELHSTTSSYALNMINKILISDQETRYIDYSPMHGLIARYGIRLSNLCDYLGISTNVRTSISKNESVHMDVLIQIADFLECNPNDLYTFINSTEKEKREMKESLVKESQRVVFRDKETPIPVAIIRELRESDKAASNIYHPSEYWKREAVMKEHYHDYEYAPSEKWTTFLKNIDPSKSIEEKIKEYLSTLIKDAENDNSNKED